MDEDTFQILAFAAIALGFVLRFRWIWRKWRANPDYRFEEVLWHLGFALLVPAGYFLAEGPLLAFFSLVVVAAFFWTAAYIHYIRRNRV